MADVSHTLLCIIEDSVVYYGLLNELNQCYSSDILQASAGTDFFNQAGLITEFLSQSAHADSIDSVVFAIVDHNFSLIPKPVAKDQAQVWTNKSQGNSDVNFHLDELSQLNVGYYISKTFETQLLSFHKNSKIRHIISCNLAGKSIRNGVHAYTLGNEKQFLHLVKENKTIYSNLVKSDSVLSQLYFSLLPYKLYELDPHSYPLYLNQGISAKLREELDKYVAQIKQVDLNTETSDSKLSKEQLFQLEKLATCV